MQMLFTLRCAVKVYRHDASKSKHGNAYGLRGTAADRNNRRT
jgi:hypothetical protein